MQQRFGRLAWTGVLIGLCLAGVADTLAQEARNIDYGQDNAGAGCWLTYPEPETYVRWDRLNRMEFQYLVYYGSEGVDEIFVRLYRGGVVSTNLCWHLGEQRWVRRDLMNTRRGSEWGWPVYARSDRHVCEFALPAGANLPEDTYWAVMTMRAYNQTFFVMSHAGGCAIKSYAWFRVDSTPPMITITYPTNAATVGQVLQMTGTIVDRP